MLEIHDLHYFILSNTTKTILNYYNIAKNATDCPEVHLASKKHSIEIRFIYLHSAAPNG